MKRSNRHLLIALATTAAVTTLDVARAQAQTYDVEGIALDRLEPSERGSEWFVNDSLDLRGKFRPAIGVVTDYAHRPQVFHGADGSKVALVTHQMVAHVGAAAVFADRLRFSVNVPIVLDQGGNDVIIPSSPGSISPRYVAPKSSTALGDLRLALDARLVGRAGSPFTLGLGVRMWAPTGDRAQYTSDGKLRVEEHVAIAGDVSSFVYALSVGYATRGNTSDAYFADTPVGGEIVFRGAAGVHLLDRRLILGPELFGSYIVGGPTYGLDKLKTPLAMIIGGHVSLGDFRIGLAAGPGLSHAAGTAQVRMLASLEYAPAFVEAEAAPPIADRDVDGVADDRDACPDIHGVATNDPKTNGCPPDQDADGIADVDDACPTVKGEKDPDPKKNGCPKVADQDADGIADLDDACPTVAGVKDADPKKNGCPPDKDGDGIPDDQDACLNVPGVKNADPSKNGCPADRDGDGIADNEDACPDQAGPLNPDPKKNGCPAVKIEAGQIKILEQIKFKTGSAEILAESQAIIDAVDKVMNEHVELNRIRVEGHTDNVGLAKNNKVLSTKRAAAVVAALVKSGVDKKRLTSVGLGQDKPIDTNTTEEGKANNRRVEFHIEDPKQP